jgi:hypothetical protein
MALINNPLDSSFGFSVNDVNVLNSTRDLQNINSVSIQNSNFSDIVKKDYILRGIDSGFLTLDGLTILSLPSNSINFVDSKIIGINTDGSGYYSVKFESTITVSSVGDVIGRSLIKSIISDQVPSGQSWQVSEYDAGISNQYSFSTSRSGTPDSVKWTGYIQVISTSL